MKRIVLFVLLLFLFVAVPAVVAQEATPEPAPVPVPDDSVTLPSWFLANMSLLFIAASSLIVIATAWAGNRNLKMTLENVSKSNKDAIEAAHESLPESAQFIIDTSLKTMRDVTEQALAALKFLTEVTDGEPNQEPPKD